MDTPPPAAGLSPLGCLAAPLIGLLTVLAVAGGFAWLTGEALDLRQGWGMLLFQALIAASPFGLLALAGVRGRLPWLVGIALTFALWGYYLFEGVSCQWDRQCGGANIGLGLIMMASPVVIAAASLAVSAWQRQRARRR